MSVGVKRCNCPENNCEACDKYFDEFQDVIKHSLPKSGKIAAFIAESIQVIISIIISCKAKTLQ